VDTRLRRVDEGRVQATLLAAAGLARLGIARPDVHPLSVDEMVPAPGQGALAVQIRAGDARVAALVGAIDDADTRACTSAERAFLHALSGGCSVPAACHVRRVGEGFAGVAVLEAGGQLRRAARTGTDPVALGAALAADVRPRS
jgi:hydroxymethylbilane synthase